MRLACGDRSYVVSVREDGARLEVAVDGERFSLDVVEAEPGLFVSRTDERRETYHCVHDGQKVHLFWQGSTYLLLEEPEGPQARERHASGSLEAPMPGKVIKIAVRQGQPVARGDEILVVEAMKMENALRAPRDGVVKVLRASVGDSVTAGSVLVELE